MQHILFPKDNLIQRNQVFEFNWRCTVYLSFSQLYLWKRTNSRKEFPGSLYFIQTFPSSLVLLGSYFSCIAWFHLTIRAITISEVRIIWIAEDWYQWARLIQIHLLEVGREIYVRDIGNDWVDHINKLRSDFLAPQQCFLCSCIVHAGQYII